MMIIVIAGGVVAYAHLSKSQAAPQRRTSPHHPQPLTWPKLQMRTENVPITKYMGITLAKNPQGDIVGVGGFSGTSFTSAIINLIPKAFTLSHMPMAMHDTAAGFIGADLYVFGGGQSTSSSDILRMQQGHTQVVGQLPHPLSDSVSIPYSLHGVQGLLLIGGYDGSTFRKHADFVFIKNGRIQLDPLFVLPVGLRYPAIASNGSDIYISGGLTPTGQSRVVYMWHSGLKSPVRFATLPFSRYQAAAFVVPGFLLVAGGLNTVGNPTSQIIAINLNTHATRKIGSLPFALADMGYITSHHTTYLAGGTTTSTDIANSELIKISTSR